eukprot:174233_1
MHHKIFTLLSLIVIAECEYNLDKRNVANRHLLQYGDGWSVGSPNMPFKNRWMLVGYDMDNNSIVLIGGQNEKQLISYDIDNNFFITHDNLPINVGCRTQCYYQINNLLHFIDSNGNNPVINVFKLNTKEFLYNYYNTSVPSTYFVLVPCLTGINNDYLIVSGGHTLPISIHNSVEIYSILEGIWLNNVPNLIIGRSGHACVTHGDYTYVFGGEINSTSVFSTTITNTIEKLYIGDNLSNLTNWILLNDTLTTLTRRYMNTIVHHENIYIIGGSDDVPVNSVNTIDVFDTLTEQVTISSINPLNYATAYASAIMINSKIFVFGGSGETIINAWQYYDFCDIDYE